MALSACIPVSPVQVVSGASPLCLDGATLVSVSDACGTG